MGCGCEGEPIDQSHTTVRHEIGHRHRILFLILPVELRGSTSDFFVPLNA